MQCRARCRVGCRQAHRADLGRSPSAPSDLAISLVPDSPHGVPPFRRPLGRRNAYPLELLVLDHPWTDLRRLAPPEALTSASSLR